MALFRGVTRGVTRSAIGSLFGDGGFNPRAIPLTQSWYDFSDSSVLTIEDTDKIAGVKDKGPRKKDLVKDTEAARPVVTTLNGVAAADFADDWLTVANYPADTALTVYAVVQSDSASAADSTMGGILGMGVSADANLFGIGPVSSNTSGENLTIFGKNTTEKIRGCSEAELHYPADTAFILRVDVGDGVVAIYKDGISRTISKTYGTQTDMSPSGLGLDGTDTLYIGTLKDVANLAGKLGEVIIMNGQPTAAQDAQVLDYLRNKWSISEYPFKQDTLLSWVTADNQYLGIDTQGYNSVARLIDKSGNGVEWAQTSKDRQPKYEDDGNGTMAIRFEGGPMEMAPREFPHAAGDDVGTAAAEGILNTADDIYVALVVQPKSVSGLQWLFFNSTDLSATAVRFGIYLNSANITQQARRVGSDSGSALNGGSAVIDTLFCGEFEADFQNQHQEIWKDGVSQNTRVAAYTAGATAGDSLTSYIGSANTVTQYFDGYLYDMLVFSAKPADRIEVAQYLMNLRGI